MNMSLRRIVNVVNFNTEEDKKKLQEALNQTRIIAEVDLENQCVVVNGGPDELRVAIFAIKDAGYDVL